MTKEMESELTITCEHSYAYNPPTKNLEGSDENAMCHTLRVD